MLMGSGTSLAYVASGLGYLVVAMGDGYAKNAAENERM